MIYKTEPFKIFILIVFFLFLLHYYNITVHASESRETLTVDGVRLEGELILIKVTDKATKITQELEFNLRDYEDGSEYISVQAVDRNGNHSNIVQFKNPYYVPPPEIKNPDIFISFIPGQSEEPEELEETESAADDTDNENLSDNLRPFTPDGTGTVVDNINEDSKEFFSIKTEDGNTFYLIIDRHRDTDNIYLLNAVTENDLMSLAKDGDGLNGATMSAIPTPTHPPPEKTENITPDEPPEPPPKKSGSTNYLLIGGIVAAVGAAAYYFKIVRPKKQGGGINDFGEEAETMEIPDDDREFDMEEDDDESDGGEEDDD